MKKLTLAFLFLFFFQLGHSQFFKDNKSVTKFNGYINFYYDESEDKIYLEIDKLDIELLYVNALSEGIGSNDIGLDRGQLGDGVVVKFKKAGNKILLIQPNQSYRAITDNEDERKSIEEAFAKSVLHGFVIKEQKNNTYLVDATDFLMRDAHGVANRLEGNNQGNYSLDKSRSAFNLERTKAFPKNVEFDVMLTFKGKAKGYNIRSVTPNSSSVTVGQHHSFVELPDDDYKPRKYDPRSGSYPMSYMDYATPVNQSIMKRFIYRHRLEKKDPNAAVSEAKEPIVYYLDRGAPEPVRSALLEGARWWNHAFEAIGYKDAFQVKMLPEGADPLDLRYNVIQWVHRSTRGWSYGGSISDPRTGEILKGHVSLGSLRIRQDFLIAQALQAPYANNDTDDNFALEMALARIRQLSAHEVGHTIGFAHNFAASANNRASVMDYPHPQIKLKDGKIDFSDAYAVGIGDWDKVTVAYSYQDFPQHQNEDLMLPQILNNAFMNGLRYISNQDARPAGSAHAYAHLWDNGINPANELEEVLVIRKKAIDNFSKDNIKSDEPYSVLEDVFVPLYFFHRYQTEAAAKMIGGLDYSYAIKNGNEQIVKRIDGNTERKALKNLLKTIDVQHLAIPEKLLDLFPPRAMGYGRSRESFKSKNGVAFDPFAAVETASEMTLSFLFHPQRASRLVQHKSLDDSQLGLVEVIDAVIDNSFKIQYKNSYHQELQNVVNAQVLNQLFGLASDVDNYPQVTAIVNAKLSEIESWLSSAKSDEMQKMVNTQLINNIQKFKKNPLDFKRIDAPKIPDGSPIGME
ncbi:zinc-dependent metalloprotease [Aureibaculum sp. 2210JD6-5]|uniref:zinc-dependent metalloprotease n=1 Tax=Aureibaculum sp. 2210JD6-5 TaxID=3103957 RepID=UPI002AAC52BC|nr:zinc-dependent metalloprotease [Aureibaculum sp. 2210JD6-5]MDY7393825.1 zinc-dependent metalloprotease [Aureibaculum sp. 2210JD6-5]